MYRTLVYLLFSQLAVGGLLSILVVPPEAGKRFFRFCTLACLILLLLALWAGPYSIQIPTELTGHALPLLGLCLTVLLSLAYLFVVVLEYQALQKPLLAVAALVGAASLVVDGYLGGAGGTIAIAPWLTASYYLLSALFLGSIIFAMILGHWYLVVPTLPIHPLRTLTLLMLLTTLAKVLLAGLTLYLFWATGGLEVQETLRSFLGLSGLFLWARILFGLIGPLIVALMAWETVKINSTQSATGLLYVATIFVLIGECLSRYVFYTTHIPI